MTPRLQTALYRSQLARWPTSGKHLLAQFDEQTIVVYQAYKPAIARFAVEHGHLGGPEFSFTRMSWIKTSFLWMMFRSGWGTKPGQEAVLALRILRSGFEAILEQATPSTFVPELFASHGEWQTAGSSSEVRVQWDPDHDPRGARCERRAIQLGLRGPTLARYAGPWTVGIEDVSDFVSGQRQLALANDPRLLTPREDPYPITAPALALRLGLGSPAAEATP